MFTSLFSHFGTQGLSKPGLFFGLVIPRGSSPTKLGYSLFQKPLGAVPEGSHTRILRFFCLNNRVKKIELKKQIIIM